jgi:hypothetical protein
MPARAGHEQPGNAELARRVSARLNLGGYLGSPLTIGDADHTDAETVWVLRGAAEVVAPRAGFMYSVWKGCMLIFGFVDIGIVLSVPLPLAAAGTAV